MATRIFGPLIFALALSPGLALAMTPTITTPSFTLRGTPMWDDGDGYATLLSYADNVASIALMDIQAAVSLGMADSTGMLEGGRWVTYTTTYGLDVTPGYRVTSISITGIAEGYFNQPAGGYVDQAQYTYLSGYRGFEPLYGGASSLGMFNGEREISIYAGGLALTGFSTMHFNAQAGNQVISAVVPDPEGGPPSYVGAQASMLVRDLTLRIEVQPVPEPSTWLMFSGGVAALALARTLKKRR
ncbi:PEP-CTERM sorting domain-containing protein [Massilia sp. YMA4]|uniref:PEP-CTERM sorting domain-containing protein n=1 Tax=Massilia sp. YMA4 TaxID=1593482 RepID=UPI000DD13A13|nr:PEP-CTERM sorting domain-containing protein [Massilia sp. YMA4]AXA94244.1 hypothetical protein DPH57_25780 [Massilia sp. YMA4]